MKAAQDNDALLAIDDLETFAAQAGASSLDVVNIDGWNRIAKQEGVYVCLLLSSRPDNST